MIFSEADEGLLYVARDLYDLGWPFDAIDQRLQVWRGWSRLVLIDSFLEEAAALHALRAVH